MGKNATNKKITEGRVVSYINDRCFSPSRISKEAGIDVQMMNAVMRGARSLTLDEFFAICKAMKVDPEVFSDEYEAGSNCKRA